MKRLNIMWLFLAFAITLLNDELASASVYKSILFCVNTIAPSVYIYMILTESLVEYNALGGLSILLNKIFKLDLLKCNRMSVFIISVVCGAPIGAKLSFGAYKNGTISKKDAIVLNSATNNISLSFVLGVCSKTNELYYVAFIVQIVSAVITALVLKRTMKTAETVILKGECDFNSFNISNVIKNATGAMINICASIVVFSFVGDVIASYIPMAYKYIKGLFEFSSGVIALNKNDFVAMTAILSFGGLSLHNQIITLWCGELKYKYLLLPKIFQTALSVFFCEIFLQFVDKTSELL